jgi:hypothetical protein
VKTFLSAFNALFTNDDDNDDTAENVDDDSRPQERDKEETNDMFDEDVYDMSPEVHFNLCNHCYTLGMPDPRPDIRCVQHLPKVHYKVPNKFLVPSGTSDVID